MNTAVIVPVTLAVVLGVLACGFLGVATVLLIQLCRKRRRARRHSDDWRRSAIDTRARRNQWDTEKAPLLLETPASPVFYETHRDSVSYVPSTWLRDGNDTNDFSARLTALFQWRNSHLSTSHSHSVEKPRKLERLFERHAGYGRILYNDDGSGTVKAANWATILHTVVTAFEMRSGTGDGDVDMGSIEQHVNRDLPSGDLAIVFFATYTTMLSACEMLQLHLLHFRKEKQRRKKTLQVLHYWVKNFLRQHTRKEIEDTCVELIAFIEGLMYRETYTSAVRDIVHSLHEIVFHGSRDSRTSCSFPLAHSTWIDGQCLAAMDADIQNNSSSALDVYMEHDVADEEPSASVAFSFDLPPPLVAAQLTLVEQRLFCNIPAIELTGERYLKKHMGTEKSTNLSQMINGTNRLCQFAIESILEKESSEARAEVFMNILEVIESLAELNNYSTVMSLWGAISSSAVHRLKETRSHVSESFEDLLQMLDELLSPKHRFGALREVIESQPVPPLIPYVGIFLSEIAHIESSMTKSVTDPEDSNIELVNVNRLRHMSAKIQTFQTYQQHSRLYAEKLKPVPPLLESLEGNVLLANGRSTLSEEELYEWSKRLE